MNKWIGHPCTFFVSFTGGGMSLEDTGHDRRRDIALQAMKERIIHWFTNQHWALNIATHLPPKATAAYVWVTMKEILETGIGKNLEGSLPKRFRCPTLCNVSSKLFWCMSVLTQNEMKKWWRVKQYSHEKQSRLTGDGSGCVCMNWLSCAIEHFKIAWC